MNRKEFDKSLQERLNNYSSHYSDQVWKNLEKELDREKTVIGFSLFNKNLFSLLFLLAGITGIAALTYFNVFHGQEKLKPTAPAPIEKPNYQKPENPEPVVKVNTTASIDNALETNNNTTLETQAYTQNLLTQSKSKESKNVDLARGGSSYMSSSLVEVENSSVISNIDAEITNREFVEVAQEINSQKIMSLGKTNKMTRAIDRNIFDPKRNCPSFNTNAPGYFLEIFGSPDYNFRSYSTKDIEFDSYKKARQTTESALLGYSLGFRGGIEFRNGLSFKTGLTYSNIREKFSHTAYNVDIPNFKVVLVYKGQGTDGTEIIVSDTIRYVEKGNIYTNKTNSIKSFEIPLLVGYELDFTSWTLQFNTGVALQLANIQSGTVLDSQLDITSYGSENDTELYKKHWGLSIYTGVQFGYKLGPAAQVYIEPNARYYPKSITVYEHPVAQKLLNIGASLGVKYRL